MKNKQTPKPGSEEYDVERPQDLQKPKFNSTTDRRESHELPAVENMSGLEDDAREVNTDPARLPKTDLGNDRDEDEEDRERIINR